MTIRSRCRLIHIAVLAVLATGSFFSTTNAAVEVVGNQNVVTIPIGSATQFFRLWK